MPTPGLTSVDPWYEVRVRPASADDPERVLAALLAPRLDRLAETRTASSWWFMRKPPGWRIRLADASPEAIAALMSELTADATIADWQPTIYEPETTAFGGPVGMATAHELFCADTHGVLDYLRRSPCPIGRRELSVLLLSAMLTAAGLDWFEHGDVFARVAAMRPLSRNPSEKNMAHLTAQLRTLLAVRTPTEAPLFADGGPAAFARDWLTAFEQAGTRFGDAAKDGLLKRGLRAILAHVVIFHWNRLGLPTTTQSVLARTATDAYLPRD